MEGVKAGKRDTIRKDGVCSGGDRGGVVLIQRKRGVGMDYK